MAPVHRILNFSAGPAVLPLPVLEEAQRDLVALPGVGMSVLEISHRSKPFEEICFGAEADLRRLAGVPDGYHVLFLQGGATLQFSMVPMNLLPADGTADYLETGVWSQKAIQEARKVGAVHVAASSKATNHDRIPSPSETSFSAAPAYVHMTSNNTIFGTQFQSVPDVPEGVPLVNDASSDVFCRPVDVSRFGLIYAGAQKNLSIAGLTVVIVRDDLVSRAPSNLPVYLSYATHVKERSLYNTPPAFAIYVLRLVLRHLLAEGGLEAVAARNERKAGKLYAAIDGSGGFYRGHARPAARSWMNVTFRLTSEELEKRFVQEATAQGLDGLKGHRSVGGIRASIYNAFPEAGVDALVAFMAEFQRRNG
ncbi:MAG TPA: 3-phosphoserine/phosphohydroxythreonine transaminase [Thermoanaerobaculia bacterium]|nr:3-phosphoserine/phosphohydroxythreonine transaminase [Thermoanaerobaculia bacterium]